MPPATSLYLGFNAVAYAGLAVWCLAAPATTAAALGYLTRSPSGQSEYLVVYGGLQAGLAAFFAWLAWDPARQGTGLVFALCLYVPIVLLRAVTVARHWPVGSVTLATAALEFALLAWGLVLLARPR